MLSFFKLKRGQSRPLDQYLVRYLAGTYNMTPEEIGKLRYATGSESIAGKKVTLFRIYDPSVANAPEDDVNYELLGDHSGALQFEGRFASNKTVTEIKDMRRQE